MTKTKTQELGGPNREAVKVRRADVVREGTGYVVRGITLDGRLVRVPIPGATLDGAAVPVPDPETQRRLAPESSVWAPGVPKSAAVEAPPAGSTPTPAALEAREGASHKAAAAKVDEALAQRRSPRAK